MIVLDSIAALARNNTGDRSGDIGLRTNFLVAQAAILKRLADTFNLVCLITNQVTGNLTEAGDAHAQLTVITGSSSSLAMSSSCNDSTPSTNVIPALGTAWHHCISTRLVLEQFTSHRVMTITKSPIAAIFSVACEVTTAGLVERDPAFR